MANRVISLLRSNLVASGVKRTQSQSRIRHPLPCRPDYWRRGLHGIGFPTINRLALPGHAAFCRAWPDALGVVRRGETWQREFYPDEFAQPTPPTMANPHPDAGAAREPDAKVLDQIFRHELLWRLPRVEAGA